MNDVKVDLNSLGMAIRNMRGNQTLATIAEKTGLSISYLSDIERGRTAPSLDTIKTIAQANGREFYVVFSLGEDNTPAMLRQAQNSLENALDLIQSLRGCIK